MMFKTNLRSQGLTLIELMVAIGILGVVVGLVVPNFRTIILGSKLTSEYNRLIGDFIAARSEAVKRNQPVAICPSLDGQSCSGTNWEQGWIVFVDDGQGGGVAENHILDGTEKDNILTVRSKSSSGFDIRSVGFGGGETGTFFNGNGRIENGIADNIGVFIVCNELGPKRALGARFSTFGQLIKLYDSNDTGIVDYPDGGIDKDVSCPS